MHAKFDANPQDHRAHCFPVRIPRHIKARPTPKVGRGDRAHRRPGGHVLLLCLPDQPREGLHLLKLQQLFGHDRHLVLDVGIQGEGRMRAFSDSGVATVFCSACADAIPSRKAARFTTVERTCRRMLSRTRRAMGASLMPARAPDRGLGERSRRRLLGDQFFGVRLAIVRRAQVAGGLECAVIHTPDIEGGDLIAMSAGEPLQGCQSRPWAKAGPRNRGRPVPVSSDHTGSPERASGPARTSQNPWRWQTICPHRRAIGQSNPTEFAPPMHVSGRDDSDVFVASSQREGDVQ